ncbi:MAG: FAD-dependent monooxygenase [Myxococcota bacterium]
MGDEHAVVIGAGIAGPVVAMALQRIGVECTVYERHPGPSEGVGAFLTVAANGLDALAAIDLHREVAAAGFSTPKMSMWSGTGRRLGTLDHGYRPSGATTTTIERAALYRTLLAAATDRGIRFEYGRRLTGIRERRDEVVAAFADGSEARGTFLVGADGIWSTARKLVDPGAAEPEYCGLIGSGGYATGVDLPPEPDTFQFVFGRRAFFGYIAREGGLVWWFANVPTRPEPSREALAALQPDDEAQRLRALFADDAPPLAAILDAPSLGRFPSMPMHTLTPPRAWSRGRVVLVGDAAHSTSPSSGQGASLAIEDAIELARCLRDREPLADAFTAYQRLREQRVMRILVEARRTNSDKAAGPIGRVFRDLAMPIVLKRVLTPEAREWLTGHHIEFDRPIDADLAP